MPILSGADLSPLDPVHLRSASGATAVVSRFGAQLLSWIPAIGDQRLFLSPLSSLDRRAPIRGGVPVVFPQFADYGALPKHGFARDRVWRVTVDEDERTDRTTLRLEDDGDTRALWPHAFACDLVVALEDDRLAIELHVENRDAAAFEFCAALHTYLYVDDVSAVRLEGLGGMRYRDRTNHDGVAVAPAGALIVSGEIDRIYADAPRRLVVAEPGRRLAIEADGFPDVVVWNPWKEKARLLPDLPDDGWRQMLCVEAAAVVVPLRLAPGERWIGRQTLTASNWTDMTQPPTPSDDLRA